MVKAKLQTSIYKCVKDNSCCACDDKNFLSEDRERDGEEAREGERRDREGTHRKIYIGLE